MQEVRLPSIEAQYTQAREWAQMFRDAGYEVNFQYTGERGPFDREWQVYGTARVGTIDIDGCGASWHGDDAIWMQVVGQAILDQRETRSDRNAWHDQDR